MRRAHFVSFQTHLVVHALDIVHRNLRERISERLQAVHGGHWGLEDVEVGDGEEEQAE